MNKPEPKGKLENSSKTKRKQMVIAIGGGALFISLLVFGMWASDPNRGKPTPMEIQEKKSKEVMKDFTVSSSSAVSSKETWIALSEKRLKLLQMKNRALEERLKKLELENQTAKKLEEEEKKKASIPLFPGTNLANKPAKLPAPPVIEKPPVKENIPGKVTKEFINGSLPPAPNQRRGNSGQSVDPSGEKIDSINVVSLSDDEDEKGKKVKNVSHYLPTGSFSTAVLLSGMDAPTGGQARSQPVPVLLRVMEAGQLPNYWNSDVDNCHVTGAAYGDISSERAHIRLEVLTCVLVNGNIIEEKIEGYVAGEDGKAGLRGRLVSKQGALIAKSLMAGIASGMGQSISKQYQQVSTSALGQVTSIDPNKTFQTGLATGASNALEKIADFYIARANETYPIIEVDANRIGEIILLGGTDFGKNLIGNTRKGKQ